MKSLGCNLHYTTAYHPESNGAMERQHRTVEQVLRCFVNANGTDWAEKLPMAEFAMNTSVSASTGFSPFFLLYGRQPVTPLNLTIPESQVESVAHFVQAMQEALTAAQQAMKHTTEAIQKTMDRRRQPYEFQVGD